MNLRHFAVIMFAALATSACRDTEVFVLDRPAWPDSVPVRLTFNAGDDRAPAWNTAGDSIRYVADGYAPFPIRPGVVLSLPEAGGDAAPYMEPLQFGSTSEPVMLAAATSGEHTAFVQLTQLEQYECEALACPTIPGVDMTGVHPQLRAVSLRVRRTDVSTGADVSGLNIEFEGSVVDSTRHPFLLHYVHVHTSYPFHRFYNIYKDPFFRPAWSPDGQTVVFSDGLNLYRWQVGTAAATVIPNTRDAVWPAWSPDGQTIAFTRLQRLYEADMTCYCFTPRGEVSAVYETTVYQNPGRIGRLVVMNADGSNMRVLGDGTAAAWMPNSQNLIAARSEGLYFIDATNAAAMLIPNTEGGTEPAVSPDGTRLVFARATGNGSHDIWKIRLQ